MVTLTAKILVIFYYGSVPVPVHLTYFPLHYSDVAACVRGVHDVTASIASLVGEVSKENKRPAVLNLAIKCTVGPLPVSI